MLTALVAGPLYVRVIFRSTGGAAEVVRSVDLSWEEVRELEGQLQLLLEKDPQRPSEKDSWRNFADA